MMNAEGEADWLIAKMLKNPTQKSASNGTTVAIRYFAVLAQDSDFFIVDKCRYLPLQYLNLDDGLKHCRALRLQKQQEQEAAKSALHIPRNNLPTPKLHLPDLLGMLFTPEKVAQGLGVSTAQLVDVALLTGNDYTKPLLKKFCVCAKLGLGSSTGLDLLEETNSSGSGNGNGIGNGNSPRNGKSPRNRGKKSRERHHQQHQQHHNQQSNGRKLASAGLCAPDVVAAWLLKQNKGTNGKGATDAKGNDQKNVEHWNRSLLQLW